jgi:iron-sulfur cluster assembly 1
MRAYFRQHPIRSRSETRPGGVTVLDRLRFQSTLPQAYDLRNGTTSPPFRSPPTANTLDNSLSALTSLRHHHTPTMATIRASAAPIATVFRFAAQPASTRRCAHCLRAQTCPFSSFRPARQSSRRPLMTESAYRPQTLEPEMPPPRNAGVPETSISGGQLRHSTWPPPAPWDRENGPGVAEREGEAQESKAATAGATTSTQQSTAAPTPAPRKSKLRPRKAPISLTPKAVSQLQQLFAQPESKLIRVGVKNRGCSGLAYHLEYVDKPGAFDETVEQDGVKVLIDSKALFSIIGSEMDWLEDKLSARFIFRNPNITEQCGCGESFSIS